MNLPLPPEDFFRRTHGPLLASIIRFVGRARFDLAEEAAQEAFTKALRTWPLRGIPTDPTSWLRTVARNHVRDHLRRERTIRDRLLPPVPVLDEPCPEEVPDDMLRMMLLCCHPRLSPADQIALTLQLTCGFSASEIARAFYEVPATVAQRLVRAKRALAALHEPFEMPPASELSMRRHAVLSTLYMLFNEGYSWRDRDTPLRREFMEEAIRLTRLLLRHPAGDAPETHALLSLFLFQSSRLAARQGPDAFLPTLSQQDRAVWDRSRIEEGVLELDRSASGAEATEYHLLAGIAACYATAPDFESTHWTRVVKLYDDLLAQHDSPVYRLSRGIALSYMAGPAMGLRALNPLLRTLPEAVRAYAHAARADCLTRIHRPEEARQAYRAAANAASHEIERRFFESRAPR